jgi:hypothetical protein
MAYKEQLTLIIKNMAYVLGLPPGFLLKRAYIHKCAIIQRTSVSQFSQFSQFSLVGCFLQCAPVRLCRQLAWRYYLRITYNMTKAMRLAVLGHATSSCLPFAWHWCCCRTPGGGYFWRRLSHSHLPNRGPQFST